MTERCPERLLIQQYLRGDLRAEDDAQVEAHLESCAHCQGTVADLDEALLTPFPQAPQGTVLEEDPQIAQLIARAKAIAPVTEGPQTLPIDLPEAPFCLTEQFLERLHLSGLLSEEDLAKAPADPGMALEEVVEALVDGKLINRYQASMLIRDQGGDLVLGNYVLLEPLGAGGMGRVFTAFHRPMRRTVALKLLSPDLQKAAGLARFQREAILSASLKHPNIVSAYDAGEANGQVFLVMELIEGQDLSQLVKANGPLKISRAINAIRQAALGLAHAHANGIIHRDVKPANLLMDREGQVKVSDLGLARLLTPEEQAGGELTAPQAIMGTAAYMAPEQGFHPKKVGPAADVYSLGCSLYFLLTGNAPYSGETSLEILAAHRDGPPPSLSDSCPSCPRALEKLYRVMLHADPDQRPSAKEVATELQQMQRKPLKAGRGPRMLGRRNVVKIGAVAAVVLLAFFGITLAKLLPPDGIPLKGGLPPKLPPLIEMVKIKAGQFQMGSPTTDKLALPDEKPQHPVMLSAFEIGKFEVTQGQFEQIMGVNPSSFSKNGFYAMKVREKPTEWLPVESVSWLDAIRFCNRLSERHNLAPYYAEKDGAVIIKGGNGFRLPTEAEWEYACRAGTKTPWSFGAQANADEHSWHTGNAGGSTHAVGLKKPNPWGLHDMHGNVPEWCWDRYDATFYKRSPAQNPLGSGQGKARVNRGGSWNHFLTQARSASRMNQGMAYSGGGLTTIGFRVARNLSE